MKIRKTGYKTTSGPRLTPKLFIASSLDARAATLAYLMGLHYLPYRRSLSHANETKANHRCPPGGHDVNVS